jgi:hypothetical protein
VLTLLIKQKQQTPLLWVFPWSSQPRKTQWPRWTWSLDNWSWNYQTTHSSKMCFDVLKCTNQAQERGKAKKTILKLSRRFKVDHVVAWRKWSKGWSYKGRLEALFRNCIVVHFNNKYKVNPIDNSHSYWWNTLFFPYLSFDKHFCFVTFNVIGNFQFYIFWRIIFGLPFLPFVCLVTCVKISLDPHNKSKKKSTNEQNNKQENHEHT